MNKIYPVILSGGSGARLWPSSRKMFPKQFLLKKLTKMGIKNTTYCVFLTMEYKIKGF